MCQSQTCGCRRPFSTSEVFFRLIATTTLSTITSVMTVIPSTVNLNWCHCRSVGMPLAGAGVVPLFQLHPKSVTAWLGRVSWVSGLSPDSWFLIPDSSLGSTEWVDSLIFFAPLLSVSSNLSLFVFVLIHTLVYFSYYFACLLVYISLFICALYSIDLMYDLVFSLDYLILYMNIGLFLYYYICIALSYAFDCVCI